MTLTLPDAPAPAPEVAATPRWHKDHDACLNCGHTDRPYGSRGLCTTCYPLALKADYTGPIAPRKVRVGGKWVDEVPATNGMPDASPDDEPAGVPPAGLSRDQVAEVWLGEPVPTEDVALPAELIAPIDTPAAESPAPEEEPAPKETRVPTVAASAVVAEVREIMDTHPSLEEIPLADLLVEVNRRSARLAVRLHEAERDAERFRRIAAVLRDAD